MTSELAEFPELLTIYRRIAVSFLLALHPISRQNFLSIGSWDSLFADFGELESIAILPLTGVVFWGIGVAIQNHCRDFIWLLCCSMVSFSITLHVSAQC